MYTKIEKVTVTTPLHLVEAGRIVSLQSHTGEFLTLNQDCDTQLVIAASKIPETLVVVNLRYNELQTVGRDLKATVVGNLTCKVLL
tara:strand:- start:2682 stop:2939 length:258 start_codon:yes stop_codon:yes gene_type:complete